MNSERNDYDNEENSRKYSELQIVRVLINTPLDNSSNACKELEENFNSNNNFVNVCNTVFNNEAVQTTNGNGVSNVNKLENLTINNTKSVEDKSLEADFHNIVNNSQNTLDDSLNNLTLDLDNLNNSLNTAAESFDSIFGLSQSKIEVEIDLNNPEYNKNEKIIDLDEFEKLMNEKIENETDSCDIENIIDKFVIKNLSDNNQYEQQDNKDMQNLHATTNQTDENFIENNILKDLNDVNDIITVVSSEDGDFNFSLNDFETISLSSIEGTVSENNNNNFRETIEKDLHKFIDRNNNKSPKVISNLQINDNIQQIDEDSNDSYHSSFFEFITEEEASKQCQLKIDTEYEKYCKEIDNRTQDSGFIDSDCSSQKSDAGPSSFNSRNNRINDYRNAIARYEAYNFNMQNVTDVTYRENHVVPEGDDFLNMFRGIFAPTQYLIENKTTRASSTYVQYEGMGFDMSEMNLLEDSDNEFKEEADECAKNIVKMYPGENQRKRRRL